MRYLTELIFQLYKFTDHYKLTTATYKNLENIKLVKPTADSNTILQLESMFSDYSLRYVDKGLAEILSNLISAEKKHIQDFDFKKIQSLTASKSFGAGWYKVINGSWFKDVYSWGRGMYPANNLKAEDMSDWHDNLWHIEHEGFYPRDPINIKYYSWLDRYLASNSGGSHHAAMVVYQSIRDNLEYKREAVIEKLAINKDSIGRLENEYYSFIFHAKNPQKAGGFSSKHEFTDILKDVVSNQIQQLSPVHYHSDINFIFIQKDELKMNNKTFLDWLSAGITSGKIISFPEYLKNPSNFHNACYSHELDSIILGDPCREYK
ncbi:DUF6685 family protein [Citrobacter portucalensis]|uniref:DUF6685 family protein n=1 Tax=Citrobacter portucalensis TaxID=1639133 RepID=UPI003A883661